MSEIVVSNRQAVICGLLTGAFIGLAAAAGTLWGIASGIRDVREEMDALVLELGIPVPFPGDRR